jgi:taurine dioxygenase
MRFDIRKLSDRVGAEVMGLDLRGPLDAETVAALRRVWLDRHVLLFRGQDLSEAEQIRFAGYFGRAMETQQSQNEERRPGADGRMMLVSNIRENGKPIGVLDGGELQFHSDSAFLARPLMATVLYGVTITSTGGTTLFVNMHDVLDGLPADLRAAIDGRRGVNRFDFVVQVKTEKLGAAAPAAYAHPAVRTHPETGRRALYVNRLMTEEIEGVPQDEGDRMLARLFEAIERSPSVYEHFWRPGDLLIWDNRSVQHARTDYPPEEPRLLRRVGIEGDAPR